MNLRHHIGTSVAQRIGGPYKAFTLIEIMVVVAIIGMIMAAGVPTFYNALRKEGFRKTVSDIQEVCESARRQAILQSRMTEVVFHPQEGTCHVVGGGTSRSARIEAARIEMLDINLREYRDAEVARVRFYPNGTSDELTLILQSDEHQWRKISVELTTAMVSVDSDPNKWR
ncbi:MAG TPA: type II secretion system protein [Verrucomicrobiae bacterium]|nr:type II secretion system protein [Verrucomicrobiae bacterium]